MAIVAAGILVAFITALVLLSKTAAKVVIYGFLYSIAKVLFELCDFLQLCFRRLAGLDTYWFKDTAKSSVSTADGKTGDILLSIFSSKTVIEALIAMTLFAVALLLIVTIIQIIRVEYTTEGSKNSKGTILGKAIKSFAMFILVPVVCFLGIFVSNKILFALDAATSQAGSSTLSGSIFLAGAADANVVRMGGTKEGVIDGITIVYDYKYKAELTDNNDGLVGLSSTIFRSSKSDTESKRNEIATTIDNMFVRKYNRFYESQSENNIYTVGEIKGKSSENEAIKGRGDDQIIHYLNYDTVKYFYDFSEMNFFIFYIGSAFVLMSFVKASVGLIMRLYKGTALFIISPAVTALTPLDDGNAYKSWRKAFMGCVLGAYGYVVALNLLFLIMGVVDNIYLFPNSFGFYSANKMVQCLMVIVGVNMLSDLSGLVSGFIGAEDALKTGEGMSKNVTKSVKSIGKFAGGSVMVGKGMVGGISHLINSNKAKNATNARGYNEAIEQQRTEEERLNEMKEDGVSTDEQIKRQQEIVDKSKQKAYKLSAASQREKYLSRAASGARSAMRGKEIFTSALQDSPVGSLLNNMTGGYVEAFGGKATKNLDDKLGIKGSDIEKYAKKDERAKGFNEAVSYLTNPAKVVTKGVSAVGKGVSAAGKRIQHGNHGRVVNAIGSMMTAGGNAITAGADSVLEEPTGDKFDETKALNETYKTIDSEEVRKYYIKQINGFNRLNNLRGRASKKEINEAQARKGVEAFITNGVTGLDKETLAELKKMLAGENFMAKFTENSESFADHLTAIDKDPVRKNMINAMKDYDGSIRDISSGTDSISKIANIEEALKAYDEKYGNPNKKLPGNNNNNNGGAVQMDNAHVTIDGDAEVKGKAEINKADIKDSSSVAKSLTQALKKKEQDAKDNEIKNMLAEMKKLLGDIKKNTKK